MSKSGGIDPSAVGQFLTTEDLRRLRCPRLGCHRKLDFIGQKGQPFPGSGGKDAEPRFLKRGTLVCRGCRAEYLVVGGVARLFDESRVQQSDRILRRVYDFIATMHDVGADLVLPLLQYPAEGSRDGYIKEMELEGLPPIGEPVRILEVGIGPGTNVSLIERALIERGVPAGSWEIWGVDLSPVMIAECARRLRSNPPRERVRLLLADGHFLPFADDTFDRVLHVGGINGFRDRKQALAELVRVAKPGIPIIVVDEQLNPEPKQPHSLFHRAAFFAMTAYERDPRAPLKFARDEWNPKPTNISRFFYCLKLTKP